MPVGGTWRRLAGNRPRGNMADGLSRRDDLADRARRCFSALQRFVSSIAHDAAAGRPNQIVSLEARNFYGTFGTFVGLTSGAGITEHWTHITEHWGTLRTSCRLCCWRPVCCCTCFIITDTATSHPRARNCPRIPNTEPISTKYH